MPRCVRVFVEALGRVKPQCKISYGNMANSRAPIPVTERCKAYACNRFIAGIAVSNLSEGLEVCLLCLLCVAQLALITWSGESYSVCEYVRSRSLKNEAT